MTVMAALAITGTVAQFAGNFIQGQANKRAAEKSARNRALALEMQGEIVGLQNRQSDIQIGASERIAENTARQEELRRIEMRTSAERARLNLIRQTQAQRASLVNSAAGTGVNATSSLTGGLGQLLQNAGANNVAIEEGLARGEENFDINADNTAIQTYANRRIGNLNQGIADIQLQQSALNTNVQASQLGTTIAGVGGMIKQGADSIARVSQTGVVTT